MKQFLDRNLKKYHIFIFFLIYCLLLIPLYHGVGQYWDWTFPLYSADMHNFFDISSSAWTQQSNGTPLSYSSDYGFRYLISLLSFINPEIVIYLLLSIIFSVCSIAIYKYAKYKSVNTYVSYLLGLVSVVNPVVFYKFNAGHINYLVAYMFFIILIIYLLQKFKPTFKSYLYVSFLLSVMIIQIQFAVIGLSVIVFYLIFNRKQIKSKYVILIIIIPLIINIYWLTNFIVGANNISEVRDKAKEVSVASSKLLDYVAIFQGKFTSATQIAKYFNIYEIIASSLIYVSLLIALIQKRKYTNNFLFLITFLIFIIFLSTGIVFQSENVIAAAIGPMFREVGHFAPIIYLLIIIITIEKYVMLKPLYKYINVGIFILITLISGYHFISDAHSLNFKDLREKFSIYKEYANDTESSYRVLSYPFFDQYHYLDKSTNEKEGFPLTNTGHDSFLKFTGNNYINNAVPPEDFAKSIQYQFLQTYNVDLLSNFNIKYLFNMSNIYESNYNKYVPAITYDNNIKNIKNDKDFFKKVLAVNGDKVKLINPNVIEIINTDKRVEAFRPLYIINNNQNEETLRSFNSLTDNSPIHYTTSEGIGDLINIFNKTTTDMTSLNLNNIKGSNQISTNSDTVFYIKKYLNDLHYTYYNNELIIYYPKNDKISINGAKLNELNEDQIVASIKTNKDHLNLYYDESKIDIFQNQAGALGNTKVGDVIKLTDVTGRVLLKKTLIINKNQYTTFKDEANQIDVTYDNAFNKNLFKSNDFASRASNGRVNDCNKYDNDGKIKSSINSDGSISLTAERHVACIDIISDTILPNKDYIISFDIRAKKGSSYGYYIDYEDSTKRNDIRQDKLISETNDWHTFKKIIHSPTYARNMRLYIYSYEPVSKNGENTVMYRSPALHEMPNLEGLLIAKSNLSEKKYFKTNFKRDSNTKFSVKLSSVSDNVNVKLAENYNTGWGMRVGNTHIRDHIIIDNYANGWRFNVKDICTTDNSSCKKNNDGTYDVELTGTYSPQKWFTIGLFVSGISFLLILIYLLKYPIKNYYIRYVK